MTISRVRFADGSDDDYGNKTIGATTTTEIVGSFTAPRTSSDLSDLGRAGVIIGLTLFCPYGTDLHHDDEIDVDGVRYRIDGEPGNWLHPWSGWEAGQQCALTRVEG